MDDAQRAAFLQAQAACAMVEAIGMQAENAVRISCGATPIYGERDFAALIDKYGIGHNAALTTLMD